MSVQICPTKPLLSACNVKKLSFSSELPSAKRRGGSFSVGGGWSQGGGASVDARVTFTW